MKNPKQEVLGMSNKVSIFLLVFILILNLSVVLTVKGQDEQIITFARPDMGQAGFDPATSGDSESGHLMAMVYETLVTVDKEGNLKPLLAKDWEVSSDYKTHTFYLREDVTFHDGTELTAEDVKYSFNRMLEVGQTAYGYYSKYASPDTIEILDSHTIRFKFDKNWSLFEADLVTDAYKVVNSKVFKAHSSEEDPWALEWAHDNTSGTGPFKLEEWYHGDKVVYIKNGEYWSDEKEAKVDKVIFKLVVDPSTAKMMLEEGSVDIAEKLSVDQLNDLKDRSGIKVKNFTIPKIAYLTMDVTSPPFNDPNFRKAIAYAINYSNIIKYGELGFAKELHGLTPKQYFSHNPDLPERHQNLDKARQLLKQADVNENLKVELFFSVDRRSTFETIALLIRQNLEKIGVDVKLSKVAFSTQLAMQEQGDYGLSLMVWTSVFPDPEDILGWLGDGERSSGGWNASHWEDEEAIEALEKGRSIADRQKRTELYQKVERKIIEKAIYIPLYQLGNVFALRDSVEGFYYDAFTHSHFWEAYLEE